MKKLLVLSFLLLPTLAFAVSVKLTVRDVPATGAKRGAKLITMVDSRSLTAKDQILVSAPVSADGKKYAKSDKERFIALREKLILLGVLPYHTVLKYMDPTIDRQVEELTNWTKQVKDPLGTSAATGPADNQAQIAGGQLLEPETAPVITRKTVQTATSRAVGGFSKLTPPPPLTTAP